MPIIDMSLCGELNTGLEFTKFLLCHLTKEAKTIFYRNGIRKLHSFFADLTMRNLGGQFGI